MNTHKNKPNTEGDRPAAVSVEMADCLAAIEDLACAVEIPAEERALRLVQLAACAEGEYLPEVAFDPVARRLREIAGRLSRAENAAPARAWRALVRAVISTASDRDGGLSWAA